jgi:hypothetical protein
MDLLLKKKKKAFRLFNDYDVLREGKVKVSEYVEIFKVLEDNDERSDSKNVQSFRKYLRSSTSQDP